MKRQRMFLAIMIMAVFVLIPLAKSVEVDFKVVGENGLESFRKIHDSLRFNISIIDFSANEIPIETIFLNDFPIEPSCKKISEKNFLCNLTTQKTSVSSPIATYKIDIKTAGNVLATKSKDVIVDGIGPKILSLEGLPPAIGKGEELTISVSALDQGVEGGTFCSGISELLVYQLNPNAPLKKIPINSKECSYSGEITLSSTQLSTGEICVIGNDSLGTVSKEPFCKDIIIDTTAPVISGIELFRKNPNSDSLIPFNYARQSVSYPLVIVVNITDDNIIKKEDIKGYFSELVPSFNEITPNFCEEISQGLRCRWENLDVSIQESKTFNLKVVVEDIAKNSAQSQVSKQVQIDSIGPSVSEIVSGYGKHQGVSFLGKSSTIILKISDDKSGILAENVFLDLTELGGPARIVASSCDLSGCYFENVKTTLPTGSSVQIKVHPDTSDALGNKIEFAYADGFVIDTSPPVLEEQSVLVKSDKGLEDLNGGDSAIITFRVRDETAVFIVGNFSEISRSNASKLSCSEAQGFWNCVVEIPNLISGAKGFAKIILTDLVNNSVTFEEKVLVNVPHMGPKPDYWDISSVDVMRPGLDATLGNVLAQQFFVNINLESKAIADEYSLSRFNILKCTQSGFKQKSIDVFLPATVGNSISVPAVFYLEKGEISSQGIEVICDVEIYTKIHSKFGVMLSKFPEIKQFNFTVPVFEGFSGLTKSEATEKFRTKLEEIQFLTDIMKVANGVVLASEMVCKVYQNTVTVASIVTTALELVGRPKLGEATAATLGALLPGTIPIDEVFSGITETTFGYVEKLGFQMEPFCNIMACNGTISVEPVEGENDKKIELKVDTDKKKFDKQWEENIQEAFSNKLSNENWDVSFDNVPVFGDSLIYGVLTFCPRTILNSLNNHLTSQCMVVECYGESLEQGFPMYQCDILQGYSTCKMVTGEVLAMIPFASYLNQEFLPGMVTLFNDPTSLATGLLAGVLCEWGGSLVPFVPNLCAVKAIAQEAIAIFEEVTRGQANKLDFNRIVNGRTATCTNVIDKYSKYLEE